MNDWIVSLLLPSVYAFLACVGFCFIFNIHGPGIVVCGFGGALGWLVYLLTLPTGPMMAYIFAAISITLFAEIMARLRRCPVTGYLLIALLPLVPGGGIYRAMLYCVQGNTQLFLSTLLNTFGIAGALAIGTMLATTFTRIVFPILNRLRK